MAKLRIPLMLLVLFFVIETLLFFYVDRPLSTAMRELDQSFNSFVNFFRATTDLAKAKWHLIVSASSCVLCAIALRCNLGAALRQRLLPIARGCAIYFMAIAGSGIIVNLFKDLLGRARPALLDREGIYGFFPFSTEAIYNSMPSGHAATAMALAITLFFLDRKRAIVWVSIGIILCLSRVIVNAHYLSDILAGGLVGSLTAYAVTTHINHNGIIQSLNRIFPIDAPDKKA